MRALDKGTAFFHLERTMKPKFTASMKIHDWKNCCQNVHAWILTTAWHSDDLHGAIGEVACHRWMQGPDDEGGILDTLAMCGLAGWPNESPLPP